MTDVREIPAQVFKEMTEARQVESHDFGVQTCRMEHGLWLRLTEKPEEHNTGLRVDWSWRENITGAEVATSTLVDDNDVTMLATLNAGRHDTGWYGRDSHEFKQTIRVLIHRADFSFSSPKSAEGFIYGLRLTEEMSRRSFILLTLGNYDKNEYWSDEVGL